MPAPPLEEPGDWVCPEPAGAVATPVAALVGELVVDPGAPNAAGEGILVCDVVDVVDVVDAVDALDALDAVVSADEAVWAAGALTAAMGVWMDDVECVCGSVLVAETVALDVAGAVALELPWEESAEIADAGSVA